VLAKHVVGDTALGDMVAEMVRRDKAMKHLSALHADVFNYAPNPKFLEAEKEVRVCLL
jgi:hypothetical protein